MTPQELDEIIFNEKNENTIIEDSLRMHSWEWLRMRGHTALYLGMCMDAQGCLGMLWLGMFGHV